MEVPRNPSLTPDDIISRSWSQRPLTSRLASSPALPPAPRARAVPPPPPARESNVIDLTSDSPPLRTRALSQVAGDADPRQAKRQRVAEVPANPAVGPSRPARRPGATASATVVIDSDSDDDDDVIVVEPTPSGSGSWGAGGAAAGTSGSASLSEDEVVGPGGNAGPSRPRQRVARRATGGIAPRHAPRSPPPYIVPPPAPNPSSARSHIAALRNLLSAPSREFSASSSLDHQRDRSADRYHHSGGAGDWGLEHLLAQNPGILEGMRDGAAALAGYYGYGGAGGLQGVIGSGAKVVKGKKYGVRMSHPRRIEEGFSRDVIAPLEEGEARPQGRKGKGRKVVEMEPVCAGCVETLLLAQSGERRPWALKCGHVVCGKCVGDAKMRCEGIKEEERKARWKMDVDRRDEVLFVDDDDEIDYVDDEAVVVSSRGKAKGKGKGKGKSRAGETGVEEAWTMCPVVGCDGAGTDLLAEEGDYSGAFELFV